MWLTEDPWPPMLIGLVVAIILFGFWSSNRRGLYLAGAIVMLLLCGAAYFVEKQIVTEGERVEALVMDVTSAFQQGDERATLDHFSHLADYEKGEVRRALRMVTVEDDLAITDLWVELKANRQRALSHFRANATLDVAGIGSVGNQPTRWLLTWHREEGEWKIIQVERLHPMSGDRMEFFAQRPG